MSLSFRETEQPALIVGQDGILRATQRVPRQPAPAGLFAGGAGGLPTRRRLATCGGLVTRLRTFADGRPAPVAGVPSGSRAGYHPAPQSPQ